MPTGSHCRHPIRLDWRQLSCHAGTAAADRLHVLMVCAPPGCWLIGTKRCRYRGWQAVARRCAACSAVASESDAAAHSCTAASTSSPALHRITPYASGQMRSFRCSQTLSAAELTRMQCPALGVCSWGYAHMQTTATHVSTQAGTGMSWSADEEGLTHVARRMRRLAARRIYGARTTAAGCDRRRSARMPAGRAGCPGAVRCASEQPPAHPGRCWAPAMVTC